MADTAEARRVERDLPPAHRVTIHSPNLDGLMVVIVQRWRWIVATTLAFGLGVLLALPFMTPAYETSASVLVKLGREQSAPPLAGSPGQGAGLKRPEDVISEIEILKSQALMEQLVNSFGIDYFYFRPAPQTLFQRVKEVARTVARAFGDAYTEVLISIGLEKRLTRFQQVVATLQASLRAEAVKRADVIDVTLLAADPKAGVEVLTRLLQIYQAEHIRVFKTPGATEFLAARVEALKVDLQKVEAERRAFGARGAVWDYDEQRKLLLQRQQEARLGLLRNQQELGRLRSEIAQAEGAMKRPAGETRMGRVEQSNPAVQAIQLRIVERRAALAKLRLNYADDSTRIRDEEAELANLEKLLAGTPALVVQSETFETDLSRRDLERGLAERNNRVPGVEALIERQLVDVQAIERELLRLDALGEESRKLQREVSLIDQSYQLFVRRLDEARISEALDAARISNVALIGPPTSSARPVRPKAMLLFLGALGAGLFGSIGLFLLRDALRPVVHSRERAVELLGVPVFGRLPEVRS
ncbi:MAG: Wzz/FepE/Etk N-terminal domain-containing protein [Caldimonas sp.]